MSDPLFPMCVAAGGLSLRACLLPGPLLWCVAFAFALVERCAEGYAKQKQREDSHSAAPLHPVHHTSALRLAWHRPRACPLVTAFQMRRCSVCPSVLQWCLHLLPLEACTTATAAWDWEALPLLQLQLCHSTVSLFQHKTHTPVGTHSTAASKPCAHLTHKCTHREHLLQQPVRHNDLGQLADCNGREALAALGLSRISTNKRP